MSENSRHIGYKKCRDRRIVILEILGEHNEDRKDVADKRFAKMRCSKAQVIQIYDMYDPSIEYKEAFGIHDRTFRYAVKEIVEPRKPFNANLDKVCESGIHYFLTEYPAHNWESKPNNGLYERWYENGQMRERCSLKNEWYDGLCESWYEDGQIWKRYTHKNGKLDGLYESWYEDGQVWERCTFKNGEVDGLYES